MRIRRTIAFLALLLGLSTMGYSWNQLAEVNETYQEGNTAYEEIRDLVRAGAAADAGLQIPGADNRPANSAAQPDSAAPGGVPGLAIDFEILKSLNKDAAAWLYCPGTAIDYPVMRADDYSYYLSHLPDGTQNANGALFIDFNSAPDFSDTLTVIYGHNMKSGSMFGSLKGYKEQGYFDENPYMYLYTEHNSYRIELLYGFLVGAGQWRDRAFMYKENLEALTAYGAHNTTFKSNAVYTEGDRVVALSTCSYEFENARFVVIGILRGVD